MTNYSDRLDTLYAEHRREVETLLRRARREAAMNAVDVAPEVGLPDEFTPVEAAGAGVESTTSRAERVLKVAKDEWNEGIHEPPGYKWDRIDLYIRDPRGLGWSWEKPYVRNGQFAWCGAFAAYCLGAAGLKAEIRKRVMPSCYRIWSWARGSDRLLKDVRLVRPGDIAIVGPAGGKPWGAHITLVRVAVSGELAGVETYEGNAVGEGPDGSRYEGVVRQHRPFASDDYVVLHGVRPLAEDFGA